MTSSLLAMALLAVASSLHCAAMCGPLAMAGCAKPVRRSALRYLSGRLVSYSLAGALFGTLGQHLLHHLALQSVQRALLAVVATFALARGVSSLLARSPSEQTLVHLPRKSEAKSFFRRLLPTQSLGLGLATGFLPCGTLVMAWGIAAATGSAWQGAVSMGMFSLLSAPAVFVPFLAGKFVPADWKNKVSRRWIGVGWCVLGAWVLFRPFMASMHGGH